MAGRGFLKERIAQMQKQNEARLREASNIPPIHVPPVEPIIPIASPQVSLYQSTEPQTPPTVQPAELRTPIIQSSESRAPIIPAEPQAPIIKPVVQPAEPQSSVIQSPSVVNPAIRGRRALLARLRPESSIIQRPDKPETIVSGLAAVKIQSEDPKEINSETPIVAPQPEPEAQHVEQPSVINPPVICRVVPNKEKPTDTFKMLQLSSNYIGIELEQNKGVFEYRVDYNPPVDVKPARFMLLNQHRNILPVKTFDGTSLYIPSRLPDDETLLISELNDKSKVNLKIIYRRQTLLRDCIHFYNVFLRQIMKSLDLIEFGRNMYDPVRRVAIPEYNLEVWPGYITAIDEFENGLFMCCDVSHRILRTQSTLEVMMEILNKAKREGGRDGQSDIKAILLGTTVITHYNRKTYRVDDIDFTMSPMSTFEKNGQNISFIDYYKQVYNINIKSAKQPMLISKLKKKDMVKGTVENDTICLVPELCNMTGLTEAMKADFRLMKEIQRHVSITPDVRQAALVNFVKRVNEHEAASKKLKDWGLKFSSAPVKMHGPVYNKEVIILGNNIKKPIKDNMDWGNDVAKNAMFSIVNMNSWAILYIQKEEQVTYSFCNKLISSGRILGMNIEVPNKIKVSGNNPEHFITAIQNVTSNIKNLQMVVIIFPNQREDRYNAVKKICCADLGIPSQVIVSRTISKPDKLASITQKIALQINCKLGGACWAINIPLKSTMIVGIDVYHEKSKQASSVVGFVASMDKLFTEWQAVASIQKSTHQELIRAIHEAFHKVLQKWKAKNGELPQRIIIYRDGVSDGDLKQVQEMEIRDLEADFKEYPGGYFPKITFIVVQKRINSRVFQFMGENKYVNPPPGTIIDNTVTRRNYFDFFLVSQHVRQGTVNPTHYIVLQNGCTISTENVQRLSYKLCHMYYNWCGTIKVPAPVQYAHKLAYLVGQNIRQQPNEQLCETLFFL
ncbi:piwi-like protein Ago3 [Adelges cooleyi]|uniref:piwi-like protein Ago3 n=1 Tax=Adelges cooleyi TaxID=133065 RepID=UPI0021804848|nr:piwi-like protein Ago3 [Adelges cooleyi]